tara:strand:+ start:2926 stop:3501 length:576 start_codon:yes stop_codon:yes gene_type:complete
MAKSARRRNAKKTVGKKRGAKGYRRKTMRKWQKGGVKGATTKKRMEEFLGADLSPPSISHGQPKTTGEQVGDIDSITSEQLGDMDSITGDSQTTSQMGEDSVEAIVPAEDQVNNIISQIGEEPPSVGAIVPAPITSKKRMEEFLGLDNTFTYKVELDEDKYKVTSQVSGTEYTIPISILEEYAKHIFAQKV